VDADAVAYGGTAHAGGIPVIRLWHCVGPMVPLEEFDDPQALRARLALLQGDGAAPGAFSGVPSCALHQTGGEAGRSLSATLLVPKAAPFFADHFPRRPVFPGSLVMNANLELAAALAVQLPAPGVGASWQLRGLSDMKLRAFTQPGETLEIEARVNGLQANSPIVTVETRRDKRVTSSARVLLAPEEQS
jgi:3-hydroxymyristoyl/3-hydroxydecanoyl-(acyl carrier protein) dehydratase